MAEFNAVYGEYFSSWKPARALYGGVQIAFGALVEIEVIAYDSANSEFLTSSLSSGGKLSDAAMLIISKLLSLVP